MKTGVIPDSWVSSTGEATLIKIPADQLAWLHSHLRSVAENETAKECLSCKNAEFRGGTLADWERLVATGDLSTLDRSRTAKTLAISERALRADVTRLSLQPSIVGSVVVPACLAGHPLSCVSRSPKLVKTLEVWINTCFSCAVTVDEIFACLSPALATAVGQSRVRPVVIHAVSAHTALSNCRDQWDNGRLAVQVDLVVTPHSWPRLGLLLHPLVLRSLTLGLIAELQDYGAGVSYRCGLRSCGLPPAIND